MGPRHLTFLFCLMTFVLLTGTTAVAQTHSAAKTGATEPTPTATPRPNEAPAPAASRARVYLPLLHAGERPVGGIFWADRYNLATGECTNLHWDVQNVTSVYFNGSPVTGKETREVCPAQTTTYTLRVNSSAGTQDYYVTIVVESGSHPPIAFSADAYQIRRGECTTLRWRVTGARAVYLNNGGVAGESSQQVCPEANTTYELRVDFIDEIATRRLTITVVPAETLVMRFWAEQYTLPPGACTTLHWKVQNAREVYLDERPVVGMAAVAVCPSANQLYILRAVDASGQSAEREITLWVGDPALVAWEVIARGIVNEVALTVDTDPNQAGDQPGYRLVIDGINALYTGTAGWSQSVVTLMVQQADIPSDPYAGAPVDWPINPGQQVEFRASCNGPNCYIHTDQGSYLRWRSE